MKGQDSLQRVEETAEDRETNHIKTITNNNNKKSVIFGNDAEPVFSQETTEVETQK